MKTAGGASCPWVRILLPPLPAPLNSARVVAGPISWRFPAYLPDLHRYLLEYPQFESPHVQAEFLWEKVDFGLKPTLRIVQRVVYREPWPDPRASLSSERSPGCRRKSASKAQPQPQPFVYSRARTSCVCTMSVSCAACAMCWMNSCEQQQPLRHQEHKDYKDGRQFPSLCPSYPGVFMVASPPSPYRFPCFSAINRT